MLTNDLLRVSRAGGGYHPRFADGGDEPLAARVIGTFQGHVGEPKRSLDEALQALEREAEDFKLVRGLAKLLEREAVFETRSAIDPPHARRTAFEVAADVGVVTDAERADALSRAADRLGVSETDLETALYADREERQVLAAVDVPWDPRDLIDRYNLSLAQTALFDAKDVRIRSSDPRGLISAVKRLRLMYEIHRTPDGRVVEVTGPDAVFRATRRYGTRFARLLRTVARAGEWEIEATIDDRGTDRTLHLDHDDPITDPDGSAVGDVSFDSEIEADFATRFSALDLDWELVREPEPLATGSRVMIPDFSFEYRHADFRVYFEIMGYWTPEYVEKKLEQLDDLEDVDLLVAVDASLGVGADVEARDHRVVQYSGAVRVRDVRAVLREYEADLQAEQEAALPDELVPDRDVLTLAELAGTYGVSERAIESQSFPEHRRLGRTLVRPDVIEALSAQIEPGMALSEAEAAIDEFGIRDASAVLSALGYRVEWEGLGGGTVRRKTDPDAAG